MANQLSPHAGKTLDPPLLLNVPRLVTAYFTGKPEPAIPSQRVAFGTSGHRGSAFDNAFNEAHILAISQAICLHRSRGGITGPLFIGISAADSAGRTRRDYKPVQAGETRLKSGHESQTRTGGFGAIDQHPHLL